MTGSECTGCYETTESVSRRPSTLERGAAKLRALVATPGSGVAERLDVERARELAAVRRHGGRW